MRPVNGRIEKCWQHKHSIHFLSFVPRGVRSNKLAGQFPRVETLSKANDVAMPSAHGPPQTVKGASHQSRENQFNRHDRHRKWPMLRGGDEVRGSRK
ncbi:hypothetical protein VTN49DRAFT_6702 [Thermomyces lanuginosus]|uniref:uncharacterized protein n=1 Tax=Thermomyces lanuginosus TaxID=5541 RepID=UPI00374343F3